MFFKPWSFRCWYHKIILQERNTIFYARWPSAIMEKIRISSFFLIAIYTLNLFHTSYHEFHIISYTFFVHSQCDTFRKFNSITCLRGRHFLLPDVALDRWKVTFLTEMMDWHKNLHWANLKKKTKTKTKFVSTEEIDSWFTSYSKPNKTKHKENKVLPQSPPAKPLERTWFDSLSFSKKCHKSNREH